MYGGGGAGQRVRMRESQADYSLSKEADAGLDPTT